MTTTYEPILGAYTIDSLLAEASGDHREAARILERDLERRGHTVNVRGTVTPHGLAGWWIDTTFYACR